MFTPHTDTERKQMLQVIGVEKVEDLFKDVPADYRFPELNLPPAMTEMEITAQMQELAAANASTRDMVSFLGAGAYQHFIPAAVDALLQRGEFFTAYTPYQPEIAQGTLQAIFEYQSLIAALTGMDVSNASHYDGATAAAEAVIMAHHNYREKRNKILLSPSVHPHYRETIRSYTAGYQDLLITGDEPEADPFLNPNELANQIDENTALVMVQYPDFFGRVFDLTELVKKAHAVDALVCVAVNPTALGLLKPPGEFDADIVIGEGQPLGIPLSYGGPYLGLFTAKEKYLRKMAGRIAGQTVDLDGKRGYVLTLTAREQHIRREKATSNICTNQGLMALASTIYLSLLGKQGLRKVAELCYQKAHYAAEEINATPGYKVCSDAPFFHEFVVCCDKPVADINDHLLDHGIIGGYDLRNDYPSLKNHLLIAVTEVISRQEIDMLRDVLMEIAND